MPYWMVFNTEPSRARLADYLDRADPYDEIRLLLFSHGVDSVGLAGIDAWERLLTRARKIGVLTPRPKNSSPGNPASPGTPVDAAVVRFIRLRRRRPTAIPEATDEPA